MGGVPGVELCIAAEEKPLQFTTDGRAVAAAVILHCWQHPATLGVSGPVRHAETYTERKSYLSNKDSNRKSVLR